MAAMVRSPRLPALWLLLSCAALPVSAQNVEHGQQLYEKYCTQCHGEDGDGNGVAAAHVKPKPRDFRQGKFKIRTTGSGKIPTDQDIANIIRRGMPYSSMPAWPIFSDAELTDLVAYVKTFSERLQNDPAPEPINIPTAPPSSEESIASGAQIYVELGCAKCHGESGRGDGKSTPTLKDEWGNQLVPANLQKPWTFRGGSHKQDVFRAFSTGLNGTPMPSYYDVLDEAKRWDLVNYIFSLGPGEDPGYTEMVIGRRVRGELDLDDPALFDEAGSAYFPIVGQITEAPREFHPSNNGVKVRAVYNEEEIAIELRWDDMRAETSGHNAPDLVVPPFAEDPWRGALPGDAAGEETGGDDDPFGDDPFGDDSGGGGALSAGPETEEFSDAVAIQLPQQLTGSNVKPYFIFGDPQHPVDLWFQDLAQDRPEQFVGRGSSLLESQGRGDIQSRASYDKGEWRVVFKRELRATSGIQLDAAMFVPLSFSLWDGFNRERGNKRGLTQWMWLYLDPGNRPSPVGPMVRMAVIVFVIELLVVALVRRRFSRAAEPVSQTQTAS